MNKHLFNRLLFFVIIMTAVSLIYLMVPAIYSNCGTFIVKADEGFSLPWPKCSTFNVTQGNNDTFSHLAGTKMEYAIDFALPEGTELSSIHSGVVTDTKSEFGDTDCGDKSYASKANYVVIDHGDGTSALYLHLKSVRVSKDDKVSKGQIIGLSGKTGWTYCKAHLHFQLQQTGGYFTQSIPISFSDVEGGIPQKGTSVHSDNVTPSTNARIDQQFSVSAKTMWINTGIMINSGDTVDIKYLSGSWRGYPTNSWGDGTSCNNAYSRGIVPTANGQALIARIGSGAARCVGNNPFTSSDSGMLYLTYNDCPNEGCFSDNEGSITVQIRIYK